VQFPNLAKMSRPSARTQRDKKGEGRGGEKEAKRGKDAVYVVKVPEEEDDGGEWEGLVGEEGFGRGAWRGEPTRLLLLDESYAKRSVGDLPEAVKVIITSNDFHNNSC
jgi:tRNA (guanine37-N1)-methyltransferase